MSQSGRKFPKTEEVEIVRRKVCEGNILKFEYLSRFQSFKSKAKTNFDFYKVRKEQPLVDCSYLSQNNP